MLSDQVLTFLATVFVLFGVVGCMVLAIILKCVINLESVVSCKNATRNPAQQGLPHRREPKEDDDYGPDNIRGILHRSVENFANSCQQFIGCTCTFGGGGGMSKSQTVLGMFSPLIINNVSRIFFSNQLPFRSFDLLLRSY